MVTAPCFESDKAATDATNCLIREDPSLMLSIAKEAVDQTWQEYSRFSDFHSNTMFLCNNFLYEARARCTVFEGYEYNFKNDLKISPDWLKIVFP